MILTIDYGFIERIKNISPVSSIGRAENSYLGWFDPILGHHFDVHANFDMKPFKTVLKKIPN